MKTCGLDAIKTALLSIPNETFLFDDKRQKFCHFQNFERATFVNRKTQNNLISKGLKTHPEHPYYSSQVTSREPLAILRILRMHLARI